MLTNTSFLLALCDARDQHHQHANETMAELRQEQAGTAVKFIITWPVWAEMDYFLRATAKCQITRLVNRANP